FLMLGSRQPHLIDVGQHRTMYCLVHDSSGRLVAFGGADACAYLYDYDDEKLVARLEHPWPVTSISFSPDAETLACRISNGDLYLWSGWKGNQPRRQIISCYARTDGRIDPGICYHPRQPFMVAYGQQ